MSTVVFRYYQQRIAEHLESGEELLRLAASDDAAGRASARFSAKLNDSLFPLVRGIEKSGVTQSVLVKAALVLMNWDVLDGNRPVDPVVAVPATRA